jgi:hypothetical protein
MTANCVIASAPLRGALSPCRPARSTAQEFPLCRLPEPKARHERPWANEAFVPNPDPDGRRRTRGIPELERGDLPFANGLQDPVGHCRDPFCRRIDAIDFLQVALDFPHRQAAGVHGNDLAVEIEEGDAVIWRSVSDFDTREVIPAVKARGAARLPVRLVLPVPHLPPPPVRTPVPEWGAGA